MNDLFKSVTRGFQIPRDEGSLIRQVSELVDLVVQELPALDSFGSTILRGLSRDTSVRAWTKQLSDDWGARLANSDDPELVAMVRKHHFGVAYLGGDIVSVHARTVDGSDEAGEDGKNIGELEVSIRLRWKSPIRSDGFTHFRITTFPAKNLPTLTQMIDTNAMFTNKNFRDLCLVFMKFLMVG